MSSSMAATASVFGTSFASTRIFNADDRSVPQRVVAVARRSSLRSPHELSDDQLALDLVRALSNEEHRSVAEVPLDVELC